MRCSSFPKVVVSLAVLSVLALVSRSQSTLQVGYAVLNSAGSAPPVASALFRSIDREGVLVWEAGVAAVEPIARGRLFVERAGTTQTAVAWVNPSQQSVRALLTLRDAHGAELDSQVASFGPWEHQALFLDQIFPSLGEIVGSLTFEVEEEGRLAAVTLRQSANPHGQLAFATLAVADLDRPPGTGALFFPQVGGGAGLSTRIVLVNTGGSPVAGQIQLWNDRGEPLSLELDGDAGSSFPYQVPANGSFQATLTRSRGVEAGFAVVTVSQGSSSPVGVAVFQFTAGSAVLSEAGVSSAKPTKAARIFVDQERTRTGVAIANPSARPSRIDFDLLDRDGGLLGSSFRELPAMGHLSVFADELFEVGDGFSGLLDIRSVEPVAATTLKLTINSRGEPILTTLPIADLERPPTASVLVFPQIGFGDFGSGVFFTRLILLAPEIGSESSGSLVFRRSDGGPLNVPLGGRTASEFAFHVPAGGGRLLRPGEPLPTVSQILLPTGQTGGEVTVNEGNTIRLSPMALDERGDPIDAAQFDFQSLSPEIATVDQSGLVTALRPGFSTVIVSLGDLVATGTLTVVRASGGGAGFEVSGLTQDSAGHVYLADAGRHAVLRAESLGAAPNLYSGVLNQPGFTNAGRLNSRFNHPSHLALNQSSGALYVSDRSNWVIRQIDAGAEGRVRTLAGSGSAGSRDGSLFEASFGDPQGLVLDGKGGLWVADTAGHTIRRIDLAVGRVTTIAGSPGVAGSADGRGPQARFNRPIGLALQTEPLAAQLQRLTEGLPPPQTAVIVADSGNASLRRVYEDGRVETLTAQPGASGLGRAGPRALGLVAPEGVAVDPFGNIYVSAPSGQVRVLLRDGRVVLAAQDGTFSAPHAIAIGEDGRVLVADGARVPLQIAYGAPEIDSVTPSQVDSRGGTEITIRGRNFAPESVLVVGGSVLSRPNIPDTRTLIATLPPLPSGRLVLTLQSRAGLAQTSLTVNAIPLSQLPPGFITTLAGGTTFAGEGSVALSASLSNPNATAVDASGNLYISDRENNRVRKVDRETSVITTVAGSGELGEGGDGGLASAASFIFIESLAVNKEGDLFIADDTARIRKVDAASGIITTFAGQGYLTVGDIGDGGPASQAVVGFVQGMTFDDDGNLFMADSWYHRVRRIDADTGIITTIAGNGSPGFSGDGGDARAASLMGPEGLAVDSKGNLYVADTRNNRIRRIDSETGLISTFAGNGSTSFGGDGGPATSAGLFVPTDCLIDMDGNLLIADSSHGQIRKVDTRSGVITTPADGLGFVTGLSLDSSGGVFAALEFDNIVVRIAFPSAIVRTVAGNGQRRYHGDGGQAIAATLDLPDGLALDRDGNIYIADSYNNRIRKVERNSGIISSVAGNGEQGLAGDGGLASLSSLCVPTALALNGSGEIFVADTCNNRVRKIDRAGLITTVAGSSQPRFQGGFAGDGGPATQALLNRPEGVAVGPNGDLYISDSENHRIRKIDSQGRINTIAGNGTAGYAGDGGPALSAVLNSPRELSVDLRGNVFFADRENHRIRKIDAGDGRITTVAGNGRFSPLGEGGPATSAAVSYPESVFVDSQGTLYISATSNFRVRRVDAATGIITTLAGNGSFGIAGENGPAIAAAIGTPAQALLDADRNLLILDSGGGRVRAVKGPVP